MELKNLHTFQSLITEISDEVLDLASFLEIPLDIDNNDDHIFIKYRDRPISLGSFHVRRDSDVLLSAEDYCNILMDIKGGLSVLEAYQKQGYTFQL